MFEQGRNLFPPRLLSTLDAVLPRSGLMALALATVLFSGRPAFALCENPGDPDCVDFLFEKSGTFDFFATGASFAVNNDADDRPDEALEQAEVTVPTSRIPPRAKLEAAFLYFGGSLYADNDAVELPDTEVELQVPGSDDWFPVSGDQVYQAGTIRAFPELTLYTVRADVTSIINDAGGQMDGTFKVRGFDPDIFYDLAADPEHTAANASFSIVLIFSEERLPPRNIRIFDGMQEVLGSTVTLSLDGFIVSPVPSGSLTLYAQEGDCHPGPGSCDVGNNEAGAERVRVIGQDPTNTITLTDAVNPPNDIFNRTINTVEPALRDQPGTDIDQFEITDALEAGDERVTVEVTAPFPANGANGELIGLVYVIVGIDVFQPELRIDSRIEVQSDSGQFLEAYNPGDPLRVAYAISNTGNLPASQVRLEADMPANVVSFEVIQEPDGAIVEVDNDGGAAGRGRITVDNLSVRHGEVDDLVLLVETECPLLEGGMLTLTASVGAPFEGGQAFSMTSSVTLNARDRCGPSYYLYGGGGCSAYGGEKDGHSWAWLGALAGLVIFRRRRSLGLLVCGLALVFMSGCTGGIEPMGDLDPPATFGLACPGFADMVAIPPLFGQRPFCIDQYEASGEGSLGSKDQFSGNDGTTEVVPVADRFATPIAGVTWYQAKAACENAGKRLCSANEWLAACRGSRASTYPYGDTFEAGRCNGYASLRDGPVESGAMMYAGTDDSGALFADGCVTEHGVYDMSGNVWEWNATSYLNGSRRGLAGGSFRSNSKGMACQTQDNYARPTDENDGYGFRCCADFADTP